MKLFNFILGLFAIFAGFLASLAAAAPFWTFTTCTTTTITPPASPSFTTTTIAPTSTSLTFTTTTITMPSSTATSYTTVTAPVPTGSTVPDYGQCGGLGYEGPTTCTSPSACVCSNAWWCQCQPATAGEFELEYGTPGTAPEDGASLEFRPNFTTSTHAFTGLPVTAIQAPESPETRGTGLDLVSSCKPLRVHHHIS